jgi:hypothetical protein
MKNEYIKYIKNAPIIYNKRSKIDHKSIRNQTPEPPGHPWRPLGSQSCSKTPTFYDFELILSSIWEPKCSQNRSYVYRFFYLLFGTAFVSPGPTLARNVVAPPGGVHMQSDNACACFLKGSLLKKKIVPTGRRSHICVIFVDLGVLFGSQNGFQI